MGISEPMPVGVFMLAQVPAGTLVIDSAPHDQLFPRAAVVVHQGGVGTTGQKPLVIRAAGPSLTQLGVVGVLADPKLELFAGATKTGENDNWGGSPELTAALAAVVVILLVGGGVTALA